ncbi:MAG TPA: Ig-like domain-containing domain [Flavitalea sp.]|nr:Ig-like domain-containing domain [Flavitalea sp.]
MKGSYLLTALAVVIIGLLIISSGSGCASIVPPTGGPRDSLPPVIVHLDPRDSGRLFNQKKIVVSFNEFVQLDEIQKNLIVNPTPKVNPIVTIKLKDVIITIKDTLEPNTTYSLDFGNAIKDLNEGNVFRNFRYVFSTGTTIDTLKVGGRVLVAETGKADSTLIVMLHRILDDSAVVKEKPRYVTRVDTAGFFRFRNIAPGTYRMYALKDESGQRRFLSKKQLFAFADSVVTPQLAQDNFALYAFLEKDTATDKSSLSLPPATPKKLAKEQEDRRLRFQTNLSGGALDLLEGFEFDFTPEPLRKFDSSKVVLTDETFKPLTGYSFHTDTSGKKVSMIYPWVENTKYNVIIDTSFAEDTLGRTILKTDTIFIQTRRNSEYGLIRLRFPGLPLNENPVLQFVQSDDVKYSHVFKTNSFYAPLFKPGEYELRIVYDSNKNGLWDTGQFFGEHRQPERVRRISRKINVKANWDNEIDIQL